MKFEGWDDGKIRTDLALEARESFPGDGGEIRGVELQEWKSSNEKIAFTEVIIKDQDGAETMGKPIGTYLTLEAAELAEKDDDFHRDVVGELAKQIQKLLQKRGVMKSTGVSFCAASVLVIGLGNIDATPDSLGPRVLENLQVTRYLSLEYGKEFCERNGYPILSGLTPGVMAQTGMETAEIVRGVVRETKPDALIVVDALAARNAKRLGTTIQLSDTGIHPGSGVGNHRNGLTEEVLHIPVFAIGVPTVISIETMVHDAVGGAAELQIGPMFVTPHDIDERVKTLSYTISEAIHEALFR